MVTCTEITSLKTIRQIRDYLLLDLETTGPSPEADRAVEIGMIRVEDDRIVNRARTFINPERPVPEAVRQLVGVTEADTASALSYAQIAPSIAQLLLDGVVAADPGDLDFVLAMLDEAGFAGEIRFIDVCAMAEPLLPSLPDHDLQTLAAHFGIEPEDARRVLMNCELRYQVLQACKELSGPPASRAQAQKKSAPKKSAARKGASAAAPGRRRKAKPKREPLSTAETFFTTAAVLSFFAALLCMPYLSGVLFVLAAVVLCPLRAVRRYLGRWGVQTWMYVALGAVLFVTAFLLRPSPADRQRQDDSGDRPPAYIVLSADDPGSYGSEVTLDTGSGAETYIAFRLPRGVYRVLNNNPDAATVSVRDDDPRSAEELDDDPVAQSNRTVTVLGSKSQVITVDTSQHVKLSENAKNVIFQYLDEVPEEEEKELNQAGLVEREPDLVAYVVGKDVRLRRSPSVGAFIMTTYDTGKQVIVTDVVGEWTAVTVDHRDGYIYSKYLSYTDPLAAEEPAEIEVSEETAQAVAEAVNAAFEKLGITPQNAEEAAPEPETEPEAAQ